MQLHVTGGFPPGSDFSPYFLGVVDFSVFGSEVLLVDQTDTLITGHFIKFIHHLHNRSFPITAASSFPAPRRGFARRSRQPSAEPPVSGGVTRPSSLLAPLVHSSSLSATDTAPAAPASLRRSSRCNFGLPWQPSDSRALPPKAWRFGVGVGCSGKCFFWN